MFLVEALSPSVPIEDLSLTVQRENPVWITDKQFEDSDCIKILVKMGKVRLSPGRMSRREKASGPSQPPIVMTTTFSLTSPSKKPAIQKPDMDEVIQRVAQEAARQAILEFRATQKNSEPQPSGSVKPKKIKS